MSLRSQIAQTLFVGVDGTSDDAVRALAERDSPVGGVFVGGDATGVFSSGVLRDLADLPLAPLVAVDDEGGRVQRIDELAGRLPSGAELGRLPTEEVRALAAARGRSLAELGVTMDFAPVVDLGGQGDDEVIGDRAFGVTAGEVERSAGAFAAGLRAVGILPTLKHFPGHGRATGDSHLGPATTPTWSELLNEDVVPYVRLPQRGSVAVMVGHLVVPGLTTSGVPASLDAAAYSALRDEVGFDGLVVTDDLSAMRAITGAFAQREAVRRALAAGADMAVLVAPGNLETLLDALEEDVAAGALPRERVTAAAASVLNAKGC